MSKKLYIKRAAEELGLTEYQLRRMAKEGKVPYLKSGVRYIFDVSQCEEYLKKEAIGNIKQPDTGEQYGVLRKIGCN